MNMRAGWNFDKKINNRADPIKRVVGWFFSSLDSEKRQRVNTKSFIHDVGYFIYSLKT